MVTSKALSRPIDLRYYRHQIRKRLWLVVLIGLVGLAIGAYQVLSTLPLYQATARVLVNEQNAAQNVAPFRDPLVMLRKGGVLRTQMKVIQSPLLAADVIHLLDLENRPEFTANPQPLPGNVKKLVSQFIEYLLAASSRIQDRLATADLVDGTDSFAATLRTWVSKFQDGLQALQGMVVEAETDGSQRMAMPGMTRSETESAATRPLNHNEMNERSERAAQETETAKMSSAFVSRFLQGLQVRPSPESNIISVSYRSHDANLAAEVANTLATLYIDFSKQMRLSAANEAIDWLTGRAEEMKQKVEESELKLERYKEEHDVYSIEGRITGVSTEIAALNTKILEVRAERVELETLQRELQASVENPDVSTLMSILGDSERSRELTAGYGQIELELRQLRKRYGPGHPQVSKLRTALRRQQQDIDDEVDRAIASMETQYELVKKREASMTAQLEQLKGEVRALNKLAIGYGTLERDAESNRRLSDIVLTRLKEASLTPTLQQESGNTAQVIGIANVPTRPINYQPIRTIMKAGIVGLVIALGIAGGLGYLNNTLETPQEAEEYLGLSVIGLIGQYKVPRKRDPDIDDSLFVLQAPRSQMAEAFKSLRTNMLFSYTDSPRKVFMVTSSTPNEGKTTISANLAIVMSQLEQRVLLIEADLRNPSLEHVFRIEGQTGLSHMLRDENYDAAAQVFKSSLFVVPAGEPPPNPAELLGSRRMQAYLDHVRDLYDVIIIDTPPILAVSDAMALNPIVDGTLLVLRASATSFDQVQRSINMLASLKSDLLRSSENNAALVDDKVSLGIGLVMNFLDLKVGQSYGYYGRYGNYYHS